MIVLVPRRAGGGGRRRPLLAAAVLVALAATSLTGLRPATAAPDRVAATTGGCRPAGSSEAPSGGGPSRATVVVDTGSGPVWSACVSFSGSISGIEALNLADSVITDLDPEYDQYSGIGKAVCKLRGVGTAPPDCLGKSVNFWSLSLNGKVSPVGAGALTLTDGDVEGWRYGTGGLPRAATEGTEAAAAPATPTTTRPPTPTTQPPTATTVPDGGGGLTGSTRPDGTPVDPTTTRPGETTTTKAGQTTTTGKDGTTTTSPDDEDGGTEVAGATDDGSGDGDDESASGAVSTRSGSLGDGGSDDGGSSLPAVLGFVAVIAAIGGGTVLVRRRNATPPTA